MVILNVWFDLITNFKYTFFQYFELVSHPKWNICKVSKYISPPFSWWTLFHPQIRLNFYGTYYIYLN